MLFTSLPCRTRSLTVVSPLHERPRYGGLRRGSGCVSFGWGTHQGRRRSVRSQMGSGKRNVFQSDSVVWRDKSSLKSPTMVLPDPFSTTPYSLLTVCFPFGITVVAFGSHGAALTGVAAPVRRTLPEGMRSAALVSGGVSRPRQPVSRLPVISSRSIPSFEISSFHAYATAVADDRFLSVSVVVGEQALQRWPCFHLRWCRRCRPAEFLELVI